ncbi:MAG: sialate O-acetylesterase [Candidatus Eisenbacteria bacterium]
MSPSLAPLFGDHMVLQRDRVVPVWGTALPGARVGVSIANQRHEVRADAQGRWRVNLAPLPAGGPHTLRAWCEDTLTFRDVLVGEVWLASGQSNMEMPVRGWGRVLDADAEVAAAAHPNLRLVSVEHRVAYAPETGARTSGWQVCGPANVANFSAVAYFFGRSLERELKVPVGLVQATWGGTEIESWTRTDALRALPGTAPALSALDAAGHAGTPDEWRQAFARATGEWLAKAAALDRARSAVPAWSAPALDERDWKPMELPAGWENRGMPDLDGVVWFRRHVTVPPGWSGRELTLSLGRIDDEDSTWFDGVLVGSESVYDHPRVYTVPASLVTPGEHVIAVRVYDWIGGGGLWGDAAMMRLHPRTGARPADSLRLDGTWRCRVSLDLTEAGPRPRDPDDPNQPGVLANGMIAPLVPYALRGVIWYQGEQNVGRAEQYRALFPGMIADWRAWWGDPQQAFLFVQLAGFLAPAKEPGDSDWALLREAQARARSLPNTAMATAVDVGESNDIHPRNKQEVGRRLALAALGTVYGRDAVFRGPSMASTRAEGASVRVTFAHTGGGLRARGGREPRGFAVAGADGAWRWARARIEGDDVVLASAAVPKPLHVRYAWGDFPVCGLEGGTGLPAEPFRTDGR